MTYVGAAIWIARIKKALVDDRKFLTVWEIEDVEHYVLQRRGDPKGYADLLLPPGKRGRATLVLRTPFEARALAMTVGILRDIEE